MPRQCSICAHDERAHIDQALVSGDSNRRIAAQFGVAESSVRRHKDSHLPQSIVKAAEAAEVLKAESLLDRLRFLNSETAAILPEAQDGGDHRA